VTDDDQTGVARGLEQVGRFSARNPRTILGATVVGLLVAGVVALATVQLNMGVALYIDDSSETAQNWAALEDEYDRGNVVFVVVESEGVTDPETVRLVDRLDERYTDVEGIGATRSLADVVRLGAGGRIPETERGVEQAIERVAARSNATRTLVRTIAPDDGTTIMLLSYGNVSTPAASGLFDFVVPRDSKVIEQRVTADTDEAAVPPETSVTITGASIFESAAFELMILDILTLFAGGLVFIFVAVYLVMRSRLDDGWRAFLSLGTATAAVVIMLAAMGVFGYEFNAIMMSVLPVALGLGVDYGLQIQTRYREERDVGRSPVDAAGVATRTTGRTLLLAMGTTVVGFGSLLVAPVPPVRQFGVTAATSVVASMLLSVTLLVALLVVLDDGQSRDEVTTAPRPDGSGVTPAEGALEAITTTVARTACARPLVVLLVLLPAVAGGAAVYSEVETTQQLLDYWPRDLEEREQLEETTDAIPSPKTVYVVVDTDDAYEPSTLREVATFQRRLAGLPAVNAVEGPATAVTAATGGEIPDSTRQIEQIVEAQSRNPLSAVESPSRHPGQLLITLRVDDVQGAEIRSLIDGIEATAAETAPPDADVSVTGKPVVNRVIIENVTAGFERMTVLSFGAAFVFLVVASRSVGRSLVVIVSVPVTAALLMLGAMFLLDIPWNPGTVSMASIALGVGIDYGLHVDERYRELLDSSNVDGTAAMTAALRRLSRPIFGSGATTMAGFGVLIVSAFPAVSNFGKTLVLVIGFSLLATVVVLPTVTRLEAFVRTDDRQASLAALSEVVSAVGPAGVAASADQDDGGSAESEPPGDGEWVWGEAPGDGGTNSTEIPDDEWIWGEASERTAERTAEDGPRLSLTVRESDRELIVGDGDVLEQEVQPAVAGAGGDGDEVAWIRREYVRFVRENGQFYVVDLGETATYLNDRRLRTDEREAIGPGDELDLSGVATLTVDGGSEMD
jgi:hydrophobe/amphiphile efflux-3 (HAE3) family protein